jgi:hypothetical protein
MNFMNENSIGFVTTSSTTTTETTVLDSFLIALTRDASEKDKEALKVYEDMSFSGATKEIKQNCRGEKTER